MLFRINTLGRQTTELHLEGYIKSLVGLRLLLIAYLMHQVYMVKKSQWKTGILLKMGIYSEDDTFETSKLGNFNSQCQKSVPK